MKRRVLIVEDDPLSAKLMRDVLRANGFETAETNDGAQALEQVLALHADLIVMDIGLPGLDGVEATRRLKADARTSKVPVLAVSAFAMPDDERRMREAGCQAFLTKPLSLEELVRVIERLTAQDIRPPQLG